MITSHKQSFKQKINNKVVHRLVVDHDSHITFYNRFVVTYMFYCNYYGQDSNYIEMLQTRILLLLIIRAVVDGLITCTKGL